LHRLGFSLGIHNFISNHDYQFAILYNAIMANALGLGVRSFISNHDIILFLVFVQQYQDHQYLTGTNSVL